MSASTLRAAAALIRQRAQVARAGRWFATFDEVRVQWQGLEHEIAVCEGSLNEGNEANAAHIASWHPDAALAVADLIDTVLKVGPVDGGAEWDATVTLARTYLGEQS